MLDSGLAQHEAKRRERRTQVQELKEGGRTVDAISHGPHLTGR